MQGKKRGAHRWTYCSSCSPFAIGPLVVVIRHPENSMPFGNFFGRDMKILENWRENWRTFWTFFVRTRLKRPWIVEYVCRMPFGFCCNTRWANRADPEPWWRNLDCDRTGSSGTYRILLGENGSLSKRYWSTQLLPTLRLTCREAGAIDCRMRVTEVAFRSCRGVNPNPIRLERGRIARLGQIHSFFFFSKMSRCWMGWGHRVTFSLSFLFFFFLSLNHGISNCISEWGIGAVVGSIHRIHSC